MSMVHPSPIDVSRRDMTAAISLLLTVAAVTLLSGCAAFSPAASTKLSSCFVDPASLHPPVPVDAPPLPPRAGDRTSTNGARFHPTRSGLDAPPPRVGRTILSMGLRSFIKRKFLGGGEDDDDEGGGGEENNGVTLHSIMQSPDSFGLLESPGSGVDDKDREVYGRRASDGEQQGEDVGGKATTTAPVRPPPYEDTQQRIRRMKGGGMTEEEKANFLNNALTGALPKQKPRGPPIRQKIPGVEGGGGDAGVGGVRSKEGADDGSLRTSAKENLWNALTKKDAQKKDKGSKGGVKYKSNSDISVVSLMMDGKTKSEEAKRKYLASVTDPDRFATFSTYQRQQRADDGKGGEGEPVDKIVDGQESARMEDGDGGPESSGAASGTDFTQMKRQIVEDRALLNLDDMPESDSARDAVESILSMISSNNDRKAAPAVQASKSTDNLAARLSQAAEEQEKRDAEARVAADKKKEEDRRRLAEIQMQREEEARRKEVERMEKARRIAEEERRKREDKEFAERAELEARQALQDEYWAKKLERERARKGTGENIEIKKKVGVPASDSEERLERKTQEENRAREDEKEIGDKILRDRERVLDIETISAARVSRTVPKRVKEDVSKSSFVREQQRKKEEIDRLRNLDMQSLKSLNSPIPSPSKGPPKVIPPITYRAPPAVVPTPVPAPVRARAQPIPSESSPPSPAQSLNLFEMTKLKQEPASSKVTSSSRPAVKAESPTRRVVRQRVIRDNDENDDDDDDDENLMRSGAPGLTVADALKNQRKSGGGRRWWQDEFKRGRQGKAVGY
ncbi:hypothetical protein ACHAXA_007168 [Cyclostephanos tholiformis]|uniref:Uncharacterized protein n=1 Tax=Cyclostephanos tholiformis TaxID=382380 RepID=A0ABD3RHQ4_9STRA